MFKPAAALWIDAHQQKRLDQLIWSGKTPQKIVLRARIVLLASQGVPNNAISHQVRASRPTVLLWRGRFALSGVPGLLRER
jgi:hypothetical protein